MPNDERKRGETLREHSESKGSSKNIPWFVYILHCSGNSYYTGITPNVGKRLELHQSGKGPRQTADRLPVKLAYSKKFPSKSEARKREIQLKGWSRAKKELLIEGIYK